MEIPPNPTTTPIDVRVDPPTPGDRAAARKVQAAIKAQRDAGHPVSIPPEIEEGLELTDTFALSLTAVDLRIAGANPDGSLVVQGTFVIPAGMFAFQSKPALVGPNNKAAVDLGSAWAIIPGRPLGLPRLQLLCRISGTSGDLARVLAKEIARSPEAWPGAKVPVVAEETVTVTERPAAGIDGFLSKLTESTPESTPK